MAPVVAISDGSELFMDPRGEGRALRVSWHDEAGLLVLSVWRQDRCVATARIEAAQVPALIEVLGSGLSTATLAGTRPRTVESVA